MGLRHLVRAWFGAGEPPVPMADTVAEPARVTAYRPLANISYRLKADDDTGLDFSTLRRMAEPSLGGLTLIRLLIEKRKDSMSNQQWSIVNRVDKPLSNGDQAVIARLLRPDGLHTYDAWMRMVLEDMLVLDAATIYVSKRGLIALDGSTIAPRRDDQGLIRTYPDKGYQQLLHGRVAGEYDDHEIVYAVRNPRAHCLYGLSPVEQTCNLIALALKKEVHQHQYFDHGSIPDGVIEAPEGWRDTDLLAAQEMWDAMLAGNSGERRKVRWMPNGAKYTGINPIDLKDGFDDLITRVACYAFSVSPTALVRAENRAVAETAKESAQEEGLEPIKIWWASVMDRALELMGYGHLRFAYNDEEIIDAQTKCNVLIARKTAGTMTADEVRAAYGEEPLTDEQRAEIAASQVMTQIGGGGGGGIGNEPGSASEGSTAQQESAGEPAATPAMNLNGAQIAAIVTLAGQVAKGEITKSAAVAILMAGFGLPQAVASSMLGEEGSSKPEPVAPAPQPVATSSEQRSERAEEQRGAKSYSTAIASELAKLRGKATDLTDDDWLPLWDLIEQDTMSLATMRAKASLRQIKSSRRALDPLDALLTQANEDAVKWARDRAGYAISDISETTRKRVAELVAQGIDEGWSGEQLSLMIDDTGLFGKDRADMIATTERAYAQTAGDKIGWKTGGVSKREWSASADDTCPACQALNGRIYPIDQVTPDIPLHPKCRCGWLPVIEKSDED